MNTTIKLFTIARDSSPYNSFGDFKLYLEDSNFIRSIYILNMNIRIRPKILKHALDELCENLSNIMIHCLMNVKNPVSYKYTYLTAAYNMREKKENRGDREESGFRAYTRSSPVGFSLFPYICLCYFK